MGSFALAGNGPDGLCHERKLPATATRLTLSSAKVTAKKKSTPNSLKPRSGALPSQTIRAIVTASSTSTPATAFPTCSMT